MILSNNFIECSNKSHKSKRTHTKITRRTQTKTTGPSFSSILTTMEAIFVKSKTNIMYFVMGILSEFITEINTAFTTYIKLDESTKVTEKFLPCFDKFKTTAPPALASSPFSGIEEKTGNAQKGAAFCESFKKDIQNYYVEAEKEDYASKAGFWDKITPDFVLDASYSIGGKIASQAKFCTCPQKSAAPKTKATILKRFKTFKEYEKECLYFHGKDCDDFNPQSQGVKAFAQKAYSYVTGIVEVGTCVYNLFGNSPDPNIAKAKAIIGKFFSAGNFLDAAMKNMVGLVVNILTGGLWGGVKGGYYIVQLVLKIKEFKESAKMSSTAFALGKIVGNCIMIVKAFVMGRRRRLMKRRMA